MWLYKTARDTHGEIKAPTASRCFFAERRKRNRMTKNLEGKTAVITGGTEGYGLANLFLLGPSPKSISTSYSTSIRGTLFTVQKALPLMNDGGSIILNGSVASVKGTAACGVYAASKAAIRSFVRTWTTDLRDRRIRSTLLSRVRSIRRWRLGKLQT